MDTIQSIRRLLASDDVRSLREGLALVRAELAERRSGDARPLFEAVCSLFHVDVFDHPELAPIVDEALDVATEFGAWVVPELVARLDAGDLKAQIAVAHALGRRGSAVVGSLVKAYGEARDDDHRAFVLYALGKVAAPEVAAALPLALEAASARNVELRDTATRTLGQMAEHIPPDGLPESTRVVLFERLRHNLADDSPAVRAKAAHGLGQLARRGHLTHDERARLRAQLEQLLGRDERFEWDRAFVVRREAERTLAAL